MSNGRKILISESNIQNLIQREGISQNELARRINVNKGSLSNALSGRRGAGRKLLAGLLRMFPEESVATLTIIRKGVC